MSVNSLITFEKNVRDHNNVSSADRVFMSGAEQFYFDKK